MKTHYHITFSMSWMRKQGTERWSKLSKVTQLRWLGNWGSQRKAYRGQSGLIPQNLKSNPAVLLWGWAPILRRNGWEYNQNSAGQGQWRRKESVWTNVVEGQQSEKLWKQAAVFVMFLLNLLGCHWSIWIYRFQV